MKTQTTFRLAAIACLLPSLAIAQGPPTPPPGAPAPTMKTLDQVQPPTPIDATHTPGDATNLFRITAPGSYYLTGLVTGVSGKNGILVDADDVTIDLRGFLLAGGAGTLDGVYVDNGRARLTLRNGTISGWENYGVNEIDTTASGGTYEHLRIAGNGAGGLQLGDRAVVTACVASSNSGGPGISVDGRATVSRCTASGNGDHGIRIHKGSVLDCMVSENGGNGIETFGQVEFQGEPALIRNCVVFQNDVNGIRTEGGSRIESCLSRLNGLNGIEVGYNATVIRCMAKNHFRGIYAGGSSHITGNMCEGNSEGIHTYASRNQIDENHVINLGGDKGIYVEAPFEGSANNLIIRNVVGNHTPRYEIAADNRYGPIVDVIAGGTPAVTGDSGADTTNTTHPWANFSY